MFWTILFSVLSLVAGLALGFYVALQYMKKQMQNPSGMFDDPDQLKAFAKSMGVNLNPKQLNEMQRRLSKQKKKK